MEINYKYRFICCICTLSVLSTANTAVAADTGNCMITPIKVQPFVTSPFGQVRAKRGSTVHQGHDIVSLAVPTESTNWQKREIYASADGDIIFVGYRNGYGNTIALKRTDAGQATGDVVLYRHTRNSHTVKVGDKVKAGQHIGYYANTYAKVDDYANTVYKPHLHFEYMVSQGRQQQYEYTPNSSQFMNKFVHLQGKKAVKGLGDVVIAKLSTGKYYTDPTPYMCNDITMAGTTGHGWTTIRQQYNAIKAKLGMAGFEVGGAPNNGAYGAAVSPGEYSVAMGCLDLEQSVLSSQGGAASDPGSASAPQTGVTPPAASGPQVVIK